MKEIFTIFCLAFLVSNSANAANLFVGADALYSTSRHKVKNSQGNTVNDGAVSKGNEYSYGFNAGVRQDLLLWFGSLELFYDNINANSKSFDSPNNNGDKLKINDRYGVKFNVGMAIFPKISPFLTLGAANVRYDINGISSANKSEFAPLYGLGVMLDLPLNISLKLSYDYQQFKASLPDNSAKFATHLGVAKLGLIYNF